MRRRFLDHEVPEALALRRDVTSPFLDTVLIDSLQRLNPGVVDAEGAEQIRDRLLQAIGSFVEVPQDDITVLVARFGSAEATVALEEVDDD